MTTGEAGRSAVRGYGTRITDTRNPVWGGRTIMNREQIWELEENKRSLLRQAYRMKQECPHMSPVGLEYEMYGAIMAEVQEITARLDDFAGI